MCSVRSVGNVDNVSSVGSAADVAATHFVVGKRECVGNVDDHLTMLWRVVCGGGDGADVIYGRGGAIGSAGWHRAAVEDCGGCGVLVQRRCVVGGVAAGRVWRSRRSGLSGRV